MELDSLFVGGALDQDAAAEIPQQNGTVVVADDQPLRGDQHLHDPASVAGKHQRFPLGVLQVRHTDRAVVAAADQPAGGGAEGE